MRLAAIALVIVAAGCASHQADRRPPIRPVEWKSVLNDWYPDSVVDQPHPCAAIVIARAHLAISTTYSTINEDLARAERRSCTRHPDLGALKIGMSDTDVAAAAGAPDATGLRCWVYAVTGAHDGRRICFTSGRVTTLQLSVHG